MVDILRDIGKISRALDTIANIEFKNLALTRGQFLYLVRIYENPGIIPDQLAQMIRVDRTTANRAIKKLEQNGLIEKRPDLENKKIRRLYVTEKGRQLAPIIQRENHYSNERALTGLTEAEKQTVSRLLKKIEGNVEQDWLEVKQGKKRDY